jgi:hypothetical protein
MQRSSHFFAIGMTVLMLGFIATTPLLAAEKISPQANWDNLRKLETGQNVKIVLNDAKSYYGQFQSVSESGMVLRVAGEEQTLDRHDILRVSTMGAAHRTRNALIGAAIGKGAGLATGAGYAASRRSEYPQNRYFEVYGPVLGAAFAAAGAGLGAAMPTGGWHDVYRAR